MPELEQRKTASLIPYARNARTHSDEQVRQLAGSIREFGFTNPVLVDPTGVIVAGHGRVMAAELIGRGAGAYRSRIARMIGAISSIVLLSLLACLTMASIALPFSSCVMSCSSRVAVSG